MKIAAICTSKRPDFYHCFFQNMALQGRRPDFMVLCCHTDSKPKESVGFSRLCAEIGLSASVIFHSGSKPYGQAFNQAWSLAASLVGNDGILCKIDDDDVYGPRYFNTVLSCFESHPDAIMVGASAYWTIYPDSSAMPVYQELALASRPGTCVTVVGATICLKSEFFLKWPTLRFDESKIFGVDVGLMMTLHHLYRVATGTVDSPIYDIGHDQFIARRFVTGAHGHTWKDPRDPRARGGI